MPPKNFGPFENNDTFSFMKNVFSLNPFFYSNTDHDLEVYKKKIGNTFIYSSPIEIYEKESDFDKSKSFELNDISNYSFEELKEEINKNIAQPEFNNIEKNYDPLTKNEVNAVINAISSPKKEIKPSKKKIFYFKKISLKR